MPKWVGFAATVIFGLVVAAVHFAVTWVCVMGIALMSASSEKSKISPAVVGFVFRVFAFPVSWLPIGEPKLMLGLNSALWGLTLTLAVSWLRNRRKLRHAS